MTNGLIGTIRQYTESNATVHKDIQQGPFKSSGGNYYALVYSDESDHRPSIYKSTSLSGTWTRQDSTGEPANNLISGEPMVDAAQLGDVLCIVYEYSSTSSSAELRYVEFDMSTDSWGTPVTVGDSDGVAVNLTPRIGLSGSTRYVMSHTSPQKIMGTDYSRFDIYESTNGTSWSTTITRPVTMTDNETYYTPLACLVANDGRLVVAWTETQGVTTPYYYRIWNGSSYDNSATVVNGTEALNPQNFFTLPDGTNSAFYASEFSSGGIYRVDYNDTNPGIIGNSTNLISSHSNLLAKIGYDSTNDVYHLVTRNSSTDQLYIDRGSGSIPDPTTDSPLYSADGTPRSGHRLGFDDGGGQMAWILYINNATNFSGDDVTLVIGAESPTIVDVTGVSATGYTKQEFPAQPNILTYGGLHVQFPAANSFYEDADGNYYVLISYRTASQFVASVWKSTDGGINWSEVDPDNRLNIDDQTVTQDQAMCQVVDTGTTNYLYLGCMQRVTVTVSADPVIARFNLDTDTWDTGFTTVGSSVGSIANPTLQSFGVTNESTPKAAIFFYDDSGTNDEVTVTRWNGSSWDSGTSCSPGGTAPSGGSAPIAWGFSASSGRHYGVTYNGTDTTFRYWNYDVSSGTFNNRSTCTSPSTTITYTTSGNGHVFNCHLPYDLWNDGTSDHLIAWTQQYPSSASYTAQIFAFEDSASATDWAYRDTISVSSSLTNDMPHTFVGLNSDGDLAAFVLGETTSNDSIEIDKYLTSGSSFSFSYASTPVSETGTGTQPLTAPGIVIGANDATNNRLITFQARDYLYWTSDSQNLVFDSAFYYLDTSGSSAVVTGEEASAFAGTATTNIETVFVGQVIANGAVGSVTVNTGASASATGEGVTGSTGNESVSITASVSVTGEAATGTTGNEAVTVDISASVTGEEATSAVGTATAGNNASAAVTGEEITGSTGAESVTGDASVSNTAVTASGSVGDETVSAGASASVTGEEVTGATGSVTIDNTTLVSITGEAATPAAGNESVTGDANVTETGLAATSALGNETVVEGSGVSQSLTGENVGGSVGSVTFYTSTQLAPISDVSAGGWLPSTGVDLYAVLDESSPNDGDYAYVDDPTTDSFRVRLASASDPGVSFGHVISYRYDKDGGSTINLTVTLYSNSTQIAQWTHNNISASVIQADQTLTPSEANAITDYTTLDLEFTANTV